MKVPDNGLGPSDFDLDQVQGFVKQSKAINQRNNPLAFDHLQRTLAALDRVLDVLQYTRNALAQAVGTQENEDVKRADKVLRHMKRPV